MRVFSQAHETSYENMETKELGNDSGEAARTPHFDQLMEEQRSHGVFGNYWREETLQMDYDHVVHTSTLLDRFAQQIQSAACWQKIKLLCDFESVLDDVPGKPTDLMAILGTELELVLAPAPTQSAMKELADEFNTFKEKNLTELGLQPGGPKIAMPPNVRDWAMAETNPDAPYAHDFKAYMDKHQEEFRMKIVWDWMHGLRAKYEHHPVLHMFIVGLQKVLGGVDGRKGSTAFLHCCALDSWPDMIASKNVVAWTSVGWIIGEMIADGVAPAVAFNPEIPLPFHRVSTSVMSKFSFNVIKLRSVMETQLNNVAQMKAKIVATAVTVTLPFLQFIFSYLLREAGWKLDSD